jgi:hypothetical protein
MDEAVVAYLKAFHDQTKFFGTWPPGLQISVGEVGRIDDQGLYRRATDLARLGIGVGQETLPYQDIQFTTEGSVEISGSLAARTSQVVAPLADVHGGFTIAFSRGNALFVMLRDVQLHRVEDEEQLRRDMMAAWSAEPRRLETDHVVVTKVFSARSGALVMSGDSGARVEGTSTVAIAPGKIELADIRGDVSFGSTSNARFAVSTSTGTPILTPMFEMLHFAKNRQWWRFWRPIFSAQTRAPRAVSDFDDSSDPGQIQAFDTE